MTELLAVVVGERTSIVWELLAVVVAVAAVAVVAESNVAGAKVAADWVAEPGVEAQIAFG